MWHSRDTDERKNVITTVKIKYFMLKTTGTDKCSRNL